MQIDALPTAAADFALTALFSANGWFGPVLEAMGFHVVYTLWGIAGIAYLLLYDRQGLLGPWLQPHDLQVLFAFPGIELVTMFVIAPIVACEVFPLKQAQGHRAGA